MICFSFVHSFTRFTQYKPCFFLFTLFVNFRLCSRFTFDTSSLYKRRQSEVLSKTKRSSIEDKAKFYRRQSEVLSKTKRSSIEDKAKIYRTSIEDLSKNYRRPIEESMRKLSYTSSQIVCQLHQYTINYQCI